MNDSKLASQLAETVPDLFVQLVSLLARISVVA